MPFVVVDSKAELEPDLQHDERCYLIGDASDEAVLRQARIDRTRGLICAVDSDAENVFITIVARSLCPDLLIVARAAREHSADRLYRAGATHVVSPYVTSGRRMASLAVRPQVVEFFDVARSGRPGPRLEEIEVTERLPARHPSSCCATEMSWSSSAPRPTFPIHPVVPELSAMRARIPMR